MITIMLAIIGNVSVTLAHIISMFMADVSVFM